MWCIDKRPMPDEPGKLARVENDDIAHAVVRFRSGARGVLARAASRMAARTGSKVEVHGSKGMLWLDNERMNELNLYVAEGPSARARLLAASSRRPPIPPMAGSARRRGMGSVSTS